MIASDPDCSCMVFDDVVNTWAVWRSLIIEQLTIFQSAQTAGGSNPQTSIATTEKGINARQRMAIWTCPGRKLHAIKSHQAACHSHPYVAVGRLGDCSRTRHDAILDSPGSVAILRYQCVRVNRQGSC